MKPVRFDLHCEGDIEKFAKWSRERVNAKKTTDVMLGVPNLHWPMMVIQMLIDDDDDTVQDDVYLNIDFDIKYVDDDMVLTEDDLEDMLNGLSDEEIADFIEDMLDEHESSKEDDEEEKDNPDE